MISGAGSGLWDGATTFKLSQGSSARSGIVAAQLARAGWTGIEDPFGTGNSYYPIFEKDRELPELLTEDLGKKFYVEVVFKLYPGGGPTQLTTPCALTLARKHDIKADNVEEVVLRTSPPATAAHYAKPYKLGDYPTGDALFSYKYSVASALLRKTAQNKEYTEESVRDPEVQALIGKVMLAGLDRPEGVEVEVKMKDGRTLSEYLDRRMGSDEPGALPSRDFLVDKFMEQVEFTRMVNKEDAEAIMGLVDRLEEVDNVAEIVRLAVRRDK
jgi:2-methylcitrate dehydratase PrpD